MALITLKQAAAWCGGRVEAQYENVTFCGANIDSRKLLPGQLFVALVAARDGHDFIPAALEKGASAVLCNRVEGNYPAIIVEDTRIALGDIARGERDRIGMKVVGITGSVGKSTTKEMVAAVLSSKYKVEKTPANHNNDIGMPMAILSMPEDTEVAVLEMGMNHFREIAYLASIGKPDVAVITNLTPNHLNWHTDMQEYVAAKTNIFQYSPNETIVLYLQLCYFVISINQI
jgi:UDP-N-acetylmuramoyl-tripeptide--D-alanyl-D-alanine ligase